jgi:hypothetical protein
MNPYDPDCDPTISSRAPYLPPITPKQAIQALLSPESQNYALLHGLLLPHGSSLAQALVNGSPVPTSPYQGLAKDLQDHGITSLPYADPRLVNVTTDPSKPAFQTAGGTTIQMNHQGPRTMLPYGANLDALTTFADKLGLPSIQINGGSEAAGHSVNPTDAHGANKAIDVAPIGPVPNLSDDKLKQAALAGGYTHGMWEIRPGAMHLHLQMGPENIKGNPDDYDLSHPGPISVKDYTKPAVSDPPDRDQ